jgi:hypothetical protein
MYATEIQNYVRLQTADPQTCSSHYEGVTKSFPTGRLEPELQMIQLSATRCISIDVLWVSLVSFAAIKNYALEQMT